MFCKHCGKEVQDESCFCAHCGNPLNESSPAANNSREAVKETAPRRHKKPLFKKWWFWLLLAGIFFVFSLGGGEPQPSGNTIQLTETDYKAVCQEIAFEDLARNPDNYENELFVFTGEVIQVLEEDGEVNLRVNVTPVYFMDEISFYQDTVFFFIHTEEGADRILEGDIVTIWGQCKGLYTYESIFGSEISLPLIMGEYYQIEN